VKRCLWAIFYQGKITLPIFLTKSEAIDELLGRPAHYYTKKRDYELVRFESAKLPAKRKRGA
jgi:hypothetical protein